MNTMVCVDTLLDACTYNGLILHTESSNIYRQIPHQNSEFSRQTLNAQETFGKRPRSFLGIHVYYDGF